MLFLISSLVSGSIVLGYLKFAGRSKPKRHELWGEVKSEGWLNGFVTHYEVIGYAVEDEE